MSALDDSVGRHPAKGEDAPKWNRKALRSMALNLVVLVWASFLWATTGAAFCAFWAGVTLVNAIWYLVDAVPGVKR